MDNACVESEDFFDAPEDISVESDWESETSEGNSFEFQINDRAFESLHSNFWVDNPKSVDERRDEFIRQTGFVLDRCLTAREELPNVGPICDINVIEIRSIDCSLDGVEGEREFVLDHGGMSRRLNEVGIKRCASATLRESELRFNSSRFTPLTRSEPDIESDVEGMRKVKHRRDWFKKLSFKASNVFGKERANTKKACNYKAIFGSDTERVKVKSHRKWSKELSSLYRIQDFSAHKGSIRSMKFSDDGEHLATGGVDGVVFIWKVIEDERPSSANILRFNSASACVYFSINGISNFASFLRIREEKNMMDKLRNFFDASACIMLPRKVFHIIEMPVHEFHGHDGEILDISWSKEGFLLSSSDDKTVRLWQLGCDNCLRVFPHNDYVTCAQFNPLNNNQFISGSIDGMVRVWEVHGCRVVDWVDIKDIVTAICYQPDGKGGIVGSMGGNCSFFEITEDTLRGNYIVLAKGKNKLASKRITGFQFSPTNPNIVVISSADSQVRVLSRTHVCCKLRDSLIDIKDDGVCPMIASFTPDGKHIVAATDNSNVYMWNRETNERVPTSKAKTVWSCESFLSSNALIAVPWPGFRCATSDSSEEVKPGENYEPNDEIEGTETGLMGEPPEGTEVPRLSPTVVLPPVGKIDYELLKIVCESILSGGHILGLVIVTGGKDGRIKTFHNYGLPVRVSRGKSSLKKISTTARAMSFDRLVSFGAQNYDGNISNNSNHIEDVKNNDNNVSQEKEVDEKHVQHQP